VQPISFDLFKQVEKAAAQ